MFWEPSEKGIVFFPDPYFIGTPADYGLEYEDAWFTTEDNVKLHGWWVPKPGAPVFLWFHGNAGNISHRGESLAIFHRLGFNVLIFDYRGYGQSVGQPSEDGLYEDATAAWSYLTQQRQIATDQIVVFGRSLGGAVAAHMVAQLPEPQQPRAVMLESTFSSAKAAAREIFPILSRLVILRFQFNTAEHVKNIHRPILVAHSPMDEIIAYNLGRAVFDAANEPKAFLEMRGDHNGGFLLTQPEYERQMTDFIARSANSAPSK